MKARTELTNTRVYRGGRTAREWSGQTSRVALGIHESAVVLSFSLPSKGGGTTEIEVRIGPDDFAALVARISNADRTVALREFSRTLAAELSRQAEHDQLVAKMARDSVTKAAEEAFDQALEGRNHAERLTRDMVRTLVADLNMATSADGGD